MGGRPSSRNAPSPSQYRMGSAHCCTKWSQAAARTFGRHNELDTDTDMRERTYVRIGTNNNTDTARDAATDSATDTETPMQMGYIRPRAHRHSHGDGGTHARSHTRAHSGTCTHTHSHTHKQALPVDTHVLHARTHAKRIRTLARTHAGSVNSPRGASQRSNSPWGTSQGSNSPWGTSKGTNSLWGTSQGSNSP